MGFSSPKQHRIMTQNIEPSVIFLFLEMKIINKKIIIQKTSVEVAKVLG
jgi:hypothetical protein